MKKILVRLLVIACLLLLIAVAGAGFYVNHLLKNLLDAGNIVRQAERQCNLRMEIEAIEYKLFSLESGVHIRGFKLASRDQEANHGTPLSQRSSLDPEKALLLTHTAELKLETKDLLWGKINVKSILFHEPEIRVTLDKKGRSDFAQLFKKPDVIEGVPRVKKERDPNAPKPPPRPFSTDTGQEAIHVQIDLASVENAHLKIHNPFEKRLVEIKNFQFQLEDLLVDPDRLDVANHGDLHLEGEVLITEDNKDMVARVPVRISGDLRPVDPTTRTFNPSFEVDFLINEKAEVQTWPLSKMLGGKGNGDKIKDTLNDFFRLKTKEISLGGQLQKPLQTRVRVNNGKVELLKGVSLHLSVGEFNLEEKSFYDPVAKHVSASGAILLSESLSQRALKGMEESIEEKVGAIGLMAVKNLALDFLLKNPKIYQDQKLRLGFSLDGDTEDKLVPDWDVWKDLKKEILGKIF